MSGAGDDVPDGALAHAVEVFLDVMSLPFMEGKDNDDLVFLDGFFRSLAEELGIAADFAEVEPMKVGELRRRWQDAKHRLATGETP